MSNYTCAEQTDMLLVLGFCQGNCRESVRVYRERYPDRRIPNHQTFSSVERRLRETGSLVIRSTDRGRHPLVRTIQFEEDVLQRLEDEPSLSTRTLSRQLGVSKNSVHRVARQYQLHPYHLQPVHELLPLDYNARLVFCRFIQQQNTEDLNFINNILFTDEACFTRSGIINLKNSHIYSEENPHSTATKHYQHEFRINVWMGIIDDFLIGPALFPNRLNGERYLEFLQNTLTDLLDDLPLHLRANMWYMHDGAPPHFSRDVRMYLSAAYPNRWMGRGEDAPVNWPVRSPDLNPCDYFLWGAIKSEVYATPVATEAELWQRVQNAADMVRNNAVNLRRVYLNFSRRINLCVAENGGLVEHLL